MKEDDEEKKMDLGLLKGGVNREEERALLRQADRVSSVCVSSTVTKTEGASASTTGNGT